jgi:hypothetical protein
VYRCEIAEDMMRTPLFNFPHFLTIFVSGIYHKRVPKVTMDGTKSIDGSNTLGYVNVLWSMHFPQGRFPSHNQLYKDEVIHWIVEDFLCKGIIRLISDAVNMGGCSESLHKDIAATISKEVDFHYRTILWNNPTVFQQFKNLVQESNDYRILSFATWNVSFPVYEWGDSEEDNIQESLQAFLDTKIVKDEVNLPWEDVQISVLGNEGAFEVWEYFSIGRVPARTLAQDAPLSEQQPADSSRSLSYIARGINPNESYTLVVIGILLIVAHTTNLILLKKFRKNVMKREARKKRQACLYKRQRVDNMLLLTRNVKVCHVPTEPIQVLASSGPDTYQKSLPTVEAFFRFPSLQSSFQLGRNEDKEQRIDLRGGSDSIECGTASMPKDIKRTTILIAREAEFCAV